MKCMYRNVIVRHMSVISKVAFDCAISLSSSMQSTDRIITELTISKLLENLLLVLTLVDVK